MGVQSFLYIKLYPQDTIRTKAIVCLMAITYRLKTYHRLSQVAAVWLVATSSNTNDCTSGFVRFLDTTHTCFIMASLWNYLVPHFGNVPRADFIPWCVEGGYLECRPLICHSFSISIVGLCQYVIWYAFNFNYWITSVQMTIIVTVWFFVWESTSYSWICPRQFWR